VETFVIQIWVPDDGNAAGAPDGIRGRARHVATGASQTFVGSEQLTAFIRATTAAVMSQDGQSAAVSGQSPTEGEER
jgi:hypothetical protein